LSRAVPLEQFRVGVVVERRKAKSQWIDYTWMPVAVLVGEPEAAPWSVLADEGEAVLFYAGSADVNLFRTETGNYRDNLVSGAPSLWVVLSPTESDPPYALAAVTADPAEGEAFTEAGNNLVEMVPMPDVIGDALERFIAEHHVERQFIKRKRDRIEPGGRGGRGNADE
jgi:hypothetical protein